MVLELISSLMPGMRATELLYHAALLEFWPQRFVACLTFMPGERDCLTRSAFAGSCSRAPATCYSKLLGGLGGEGNSSTICECCLHVFLGPVARH